MKRIEPDQAPSLSKREHIGFGSQTKEAGRDLAVVARWQVCLVAIVRGSFEAGDAMHRGGSPPHRSRGLAAPGPGQRLHADDRLPERDRSSDPCGIRSETAETIGCRGR